MDRERWRERGWALASVAVARNSSFLPGVYQTSISIHLRGASFPTFHRGVDRYLFSLSIFLAVSLSRQCLMT